MSALPTDLAAHRVPPPSLYDVARSRTPVTAHVAITSGAMRWMIHLGSAEGRILTGLLVEPGDFDAFVAKIASHLSGSQAVMVTSRALGESLEGRVPWILGHSHAAYAAIRDWTVPDPPLDLVVTSDASQRKHHLGAGLGWVIDPGRQGLEAVCGHRWDERARTIDEAELLSCAEAINHARKLASVWRTPVRSMHLRTDSRQALRMLATLSEGGNPFERLGTPLPVRSRIRTLLARAEGIEITTSWVRGHAGDAHNEAADRMAVAARRTHGLPQARLLMRNVAERALESLADPPAHREIASTTTEMRRTP